MIRVQLRLFITGRTPRSQQALANLRKTCDREMDRGYELTIIDVLEHPQWAEDEKIIATPTLIKTLPLPFRRIIGDLSDTEKLLVGLDIPPGARLAMISGDADEPEAGLER